MQRSMSVCLVFVLSVIASCALAPWLRAAPSFRLQQAIDATVFIKVQRYWRRHDLSNTGSGFFIHHKGYILTNLHVVSEQVEVLDRNTVRRLSCSVTDIRVVINPGTGREQVLGAKVVGKDLRHDLALLKVDFSPRSWISPQPHVDAALMDEIYIVGYPFGQLLSFDETERLAYDRNPEPSVNAGRVTSLRKSDDRTVAAIQIDAAVNPGNSGGPMLNSQGQLAGVVFAEMSGGNQIGFAIPPDDIWRFYENQLVQVNFLPPYVPMPRSTIRLEVEPGIMPLEAQRGEATISGEGIESSTLELVREHDIWKAGILFPDSANEQPGHPFYVKLEFWDAQGHSVLSRSFKLRAQRSNEQSLTNVDDAATTMETRSIVGDRGNISLHEYARRQAEQTPRGDAGTAPAVAPTPTPEPELGGTWAPIEPEDDDGLHTDMARYGKEFYRDGRFADAVEAFELALKADPGDAVATEYLEMARERLRLQQDVEKATTGSTAEERREEIYATAMSESAPSPEEDAIAVAGTAELTLIFESPLSEGRIELWLDDEALTPVDFAFTKSLRKRLRSERTGGGHVEEVMQMPTGRHHLKVVVHEIESGALGEHSFTETFRSGSRWTLRINMRDAEATPTMFLVERR